MLRMLSTANCRQSTAHFLNHQFSLVAVARKIYKPQKKAHLRAFFYGGEINKGF